MDKFRQISTELLPFIGVENWFKRCGFGLYMDKFVTTSKELLPLIRVEIWFPCSISCIFGGLSSNFVYELVFMRTGLRL